MVKKYINTTIKQNLKNTWSLLEEVVIRKVVSCELLWSGRRRVKWNQRESCNVSSGWVWTKVAGRCWRYLCFSFSTQLMLEKYSSYIHLVFPASENAHKHTLSLSFQPHSLKALASWSGSKLQDGPQWSPPPGTHTFVSFTFPLCQGMVWVTNKTQQSDGVSLLRIAYKNCSFCLGLSLLPSLGEASHSMGTLRHPEERPMWWGTEVSCQHTHVIMEWMSRLQMTVVSAAAWLQLHEPEPSDNTFQILDL